MSAGKCHTCKSKPAQGRDPKSKLLFCGRPCQVGYHLALIEAGKKRDRSPSPAPNDKGKEEMPAAAPAPAAAGAGETALDHVLHVLKKAPAMIERLA